MITLPSDFQLDGEELSAVCRVGMMEPSWIWGGRIKQFDGCSSVEVVGELVSLPDFFIGATVGLLVGFALVCLVGFLVGVLGVGRVVGWFVEWHNIGGGGLFVGDFVIASFSVMESSPRRFRAFF